MALHLGSQRRAERRHDQRRGDALARDVGHDDTDAVPAERHIVVVVAPDRVRRQVDRGHVVAREPGRPARQQAELHLARHAQLILDALLLEHLPVQQRLLDRERGRAREELQELGIVGGEGRLTVALDVEAADDARLAHDRHRQLRERARAARHVARVETHVGRQHRLAGVDDMADDALAGAQHRVVRGRVVEAQLQHARDQVGVGAQRHRAVEHEHPGGVVGDAERSAWSRSSRTAVRSSVRLIRWRQLEQQSVLPLGRERHASKLTRAPPAAEPGGRGRSAAARVLLRPAQEPLVARAQQLRLAGAVGLARQDQQLRGHAPRRSAL